MKTLNLTPKTSHYWCTLCSSKVPSEVIQEAEEEEINNDEKSDEGNCFDTFEYE